MSDDLTREDLEALVSEATKTANDPATPFAQAMLLRRLRKVALSVLAGIPEEEDEPEDDYTPEDGDDDEEGVLPANEW